MARQLAAGAPRVDVDPKLLAELHMYEAAVGGRSILDYMPRISPMMPGGVVGLAPLHLLPIANAIAQAEYGPVRICVSVPPRHGKTELILHAIAWWLQRHPEHTIAYCSYSGDIAYGKSIRARDIALASGVPIRGDSYKAQEWRTMSGGGLLATGVMGALTGHGANLVIVDDPIKNREEAESETHRKKVDEWFTSTAMTRVTPGGSVIVIHTRWHSDDLIGRLKRKGGWTVINLPALSDSGQYLWPEGGWDASVLAQRRKEIGEYDWWALFQGEPRPRGGRMFDAPTYYDKPTLISSTGGPRIQIFMACDPAATAKTHADYSVIVVASVWVGTDGMPHMDILDVHRIQVEIPRLVYTLKHYCEKWKAAVGIEAVGGFKAVPQTLRTLLKGVPIIDIPAVTDKFTRALPAAAAWNAGRIRLPGVRDALGVLGADIERHPWIEQYLMEMGEFTGIADDHDDQVDATAHLYWLAANKGAGRKQRTASELSRYMPFG